MIRSDCKKLTRYRAGVVVCFYETILHSPSISDTSPDVGFAVIWSCVLAYDIVVFGLTLYRVLGVGHLWRGSLYTTILRDGECGSI